MLLSNASLLITMPQLYNSCESQQPIMMQFTRFTNYVDAYVLESARLLKYADMGFEMAMRNEWALSGMLASNFLANLVNFLYLFASADNHRRVIEPTDTTEEDDDKTASAKDNE